MELRLSNEGEVDLKVRLRVHQTLSVEDPQRSDARKCVESDSGTDSPGRHIDAGAGAADAYPDSDRALPVDLALFPHEARIPARSHKRVVARLDLRQRAFYRFGISYEAIKYLSMHQRLRLSAGGHLLRCAALISRRLKRTHA